MLINRTHISHFAVKINENVVPADGIVQLTGTLGACRRFAYYLGLSRNQFRNGDGSIASDETYRLVDVDGKPHGFIHEFESGIQLVIDADYMKGMIA